AAAAPPPHHQHFGFVLASCERGDLRPTPSGVEIYADETKTVETLPPPGVPRAEGVDELYDAVVHGKPPLHSGEWAMATLEACLALLRSAADQAEVELRHQIAVPAPS